MPDDATFRQLRAHRVLGDLLRMGLPAVAWTVGAEGLLTGRCAQPTSAGRRQAWDVWAQALGAVRAPETIHAITYGGAAAEVMALTAYVRIAGVRVALLANIDGG